MAQKPHRSLDGVVLWGGRRISRPRDRHLGAAAIGHHERKARLLEMHPLLVGRRIELAWTAFILGLVVLGLATSDGEPVCEGPFITEVDDSFPPQCGSPLDVVPAVLIGWAVILVTIVGVRWLASHGRED